MAISAILPFRPTSAYVHEYFARHLYDLLMWHLPPSKRAALQQYLTDSVERFFSLPPILAYDAMPRDLVDEIIEVLYRGMRTRLPGSPCAITRRGRALKLSDGVSARWRGVPS